MILSVAVYSLCLFPPIIFGFIAREYSQKQRVLVNLLVFLPAFIFAGLRDSSVGTDTEMYHGYFQALQIRESFGLDQFYYYFQLIVKSSGGNFQIFLFFQAMFCWIFYSVGAARTDKKLPLLVVGLLPVIMVDATFNGLRYGMAFAFALFLISKIKKPKNILQTVLYLAPGMFHSSMLVLMLATVSGLFVLGAVIFGLALSPKFYFLFDYFFYKANDYADMERTSWFSGLVPVIQISIILLIGRISGVRFKFGINLFTLSVFIAGISIIVAFYSMSALRFVQVALFLLTIAVSREIVEDKSRGHAGYLVLLLGLLGVGNFLRQIFLVGAAGNVFFVPYLFY